MIKSSRRNFALTNVRINWPESSTAKGIYNFDNWTVLRHAFLNTWAKLYLTTDLLILSRVYFKTAFFQVVFRGHKKTSSGCVMCEEGDGRQYSKIGFSLWNFEVLTSTWDEWTSTSNMREWTAAAYLMKSSDNKALLWSTPSVIT